MKKALITGVTGQDGAYLSKLLLKKNYKVYGVKRRSSTINTQRVDDIYKDINLKSDFILFYGDLTDATSILNLIKKTKPNEIYNLAAQSHVQVSFEVPEYSGTSNDTCTCDCAARLYISLGLVFFIKFKIDVASVKSP